MLENHQTDKFWDFVSKKDVTFIDQVSYIKLFLSVQKPLPTGDGWA